MLGFFSAQSLKRYGHFSEFGVEIALNHHFVEKIVNFSVKTNTTIHGPHTYGVDSSTARCIPGLI